MNQRWDRISWVMGLQIRLNQYDLICGGKIVDLLRENNKSMCDSHLEALRRANPIMIFLCRLDCHRHLRDKPLVISEETRSIA